MAEDVADVYEQPVRVKITHPDGSWAKASVTRVPPKSEWAEGESVEVLKDESGADVYGGALAPEYGEAPKKAAASSKEASK